MFVAKTAAHFFLDPLYIIQTFLKNYDPPPWGFKNPEWKFGFFFNPPPTPQIRDFPPNFYFFDYDASPMFISTGQKEKKTFISFVRTKMGTNIYIY